MRLVKKIEKDGAFLFRWRSVLPLVLVPAWLVAIVDGARWESVVGEGAADLWTLVTLLISVGGLAVRAATIGFVPAGTSGRGTGAQRAEALNTTGMYSMVRNPLYLGNFLAIAGIALATKTLWFPVVAGLCYWLYIERIIAAEEAFLAARFGESFARWAAVTPAFLPRWRGWRRPPLDFSLRTVLQREHHGLLAVAAAFTLFEWFVDIVGEDETLEQWLQTDWPWPTFLAAAAATYLTVQALRKHTRVLAVPGR